MMFLWFIVAFVALILEMSSPGLFFFLAFFFGAVITAVVSIWYSWMVQGWVFLGTTLIAFLALSRWLKAENKHIPKTNVYALQGKQAIVLEEIVPQWGGVVKIGGELWSAKSASASVIKVGALVHILHVQGTHVIVSEIKNARE